MYRALLLAGGFGSRLRPVTLAVPKPILPVGDQAIIEILVRQIASIPIGEIYVALGYMANHVRGYLEYVAHDLNLCFLKENHPLGTAGPIASLPEDTATALVCNGDLLTDLRFSELLLKHRESQVDITVVGVEFPHHLPYGRLKTSRDGKLLQWVEKPVLKSIVSAGIYVLSQRAIRLVEKNEYLEMPDLVDRALVTELKVQVYHFSGIWYDLGDPKQYEMANAHYTKHPKLFLSGRKESF